MAGLQPTKCIAVQEDYFEVIEINLVCVCVCVCVYN
jgi:hypothetical protein